MKLATAIEYLESQNTSFKHIIEKVSIFDGLEENRWTDAMAEFHNSSGCFDWVGDYDFGALVLENEADKTQNPELKRFLLHHALLRATWCTECASAGGELMARSRYEDELKAKLKTCT